LKTLKYFFIFIALACSGIFHACRPEEEFTNDPSVRLSFSADTVLFDTVFSPLDSQRLRPLSVTKQLRVTNTNKNAVKVNIRLAGMAGTTYRLNIDGVPANAVYGKEILGKDSLIIFIQCYIDTTQNDTAVNPFIKTDEIVFETNGNKQSVVLTAWGQNANYLNNTVLNCNAGNLRWSPGKPIVIYDSILVPEGCTLTIDAGTRIHSYNKSCLLVAGTLIVNGTYENPVVFEGTRIDGDYKDLSNQWIGIRFLPRSKDNIIQYAIIRNGFVGIEVDSQPVTANPNLRLRNCKINNMAAVGVVGYSSQIEAINNEITNCGQFGFFGAIGGNYTLIHNTIASINSSFNRQNPLVVFDNSPFLNSDRQIVARYLLTFTLVNNIVWGGLDEELLINNNPDGLPPGNIAIQNNLLRTKQTGLTSSGNIVNRDPLFENVAKLNYKLKATSPAKARGINAGVSSDLGNNPRAVTAPSIGCWE
jgi:hypothetical protein